MRGISTSTTDTFITSGGTAVRYSDIFEGILANVETYGKTCGGRLAGQSLEDIFQNAAMKAVRSHGTYDESRSAPATWGSRIADHCETDSFNREFRRSVTFTSLEIPDRKAGTAVLKDTDRLAGDESEADSRIRTTEAEDYIMSRIASLNESYRHILALQLQGLRPSKMAEALGCTPGVAATTLCRARKALRRALGEQFLGEFGYAV